MCSYCQNWAEHQWDLLETHRSCEKKMGQRKVTRTTHKIGFSSRKKNEDHEETSRNKKPVLDVPSPVQIQLWIWKSVVASPSINIKESCPSKYTRCLTIQNSSDEDGSSNETETRSAHHSVSPRSPATDRLTQSQKVTEMPRSFQQFTSSGQMTKSTRQSLDIQILLRSRPVPDTGQQIARHGTLLNRWTVNKH